MPSQVTITAPYGPGLEATAMVLPDVTQVNFNLIDKSLQVTTDGRIQTYDLVDVATVTCTVSSGNYIFALS